MDLLLSSVPRSKTQSETDSLSRHAQIIQILSLYVDVYSGEEKHRAQQQQMQHLSAQHKIRGVSINKQLTVSHAMTEVEGLLSSILATGKAVLEQVPVDFTAASSVSVPLLE